MARSADIRAETTALRETHWTDDDGRMWAVWLPAHAPDEDASMGIPIGPPSLAEMGWPLAFEVRLHNQLYHRRIFTEADARARAHDIVQAIAAAAKADAHRVIEAYSATILTAVGDGG